LHLEEEKAEEGNSKNDGSREDGKEWGCKKEVGAGASARFAGSACWRCEASQRTCRSAPPGKAGASRILATFWLLGARLGVGATLGRPGLHRGATGLQRRQPAVGSTGASGGDESAPGAATVLDVLVPNE
jgi:hypothetical protein